MPEIVFTTIAVLLFAAAWRLALRISIQDTYKDRLFDVRDEMRLHFARRGQLDSDAYRVLRDRINRYICFVERASFSEAYCFNRNMAAHPEVARELRRRIEAELEFGDRQLDRYARAIRKKCVRIIQSYVFHSSLFSVCTIYLVCVPIAVSCVTCLIIHRRVHKSWKKIQEDIRSMVAAREDHAIEAENTELLAQSGNRLSGFPLAYV